MIIENLMLKNYRNYSDFTIDFKPNFNVILGENGVGKTNLVEAIYYTSFLSSYRTNQDTSLIKFLEEDFVIKIKTNDYFAIEYKNKQKTLKYNYKKISKQSEFYSLLKVVYFSPETIDLLIKGPNIRRKYLDMIISSYDKEYLYHLSAYNYVLKQRNEYLKQMLINNLATEDYLKIIDEKLLVHGQYLVEKREKLILRFNELCEDLFQNFFEFPLRLEYITSTDNFLEKLTERLNRDISLGQTQVGPHRDDFKFLVDNRDARYFCSKGQQRLLLITLKIAELSIVYKITNEKPILILDDVLSELDSQRQLRLFNYLSKLDIQTIITTTELNDFLLNNTLNIIQL